jgi:hypothetical protein
MNLQLLKLVAMVGMVLCAYMYGHSEGSNAVTAKWQTEKAQANADALKAVQDAQDKVSKIEHDRAKEVSILDVKYQQSLSKVKNEKELAIANAKSDGLFINASCSDNSNTLSNTGSTASSSHGNTRVKLSDEAGSFLIQLASEADEVAQQLNACQQLLTIK